MTLSELLENNGISKVKMAQKIGMNESTFKNKLSESHSAYFAPEEMIRIKKALGEMGVDLVNYSKSKTDL